MYIREDILKRLYAQHKSNDKNIYLETVFYYIRVLGSFLTATCDKMIMLITKIQGHYKKLHQNKTAAALFCNNMDSFSLQKCK